MWLQRLKCSSIAGSPLPTKGSDIRKNSGLWLAVELDLKNWDLNQDRGPFQPKTLEKKAST